MNGRFVTGHVFANFFGKNPFLGQITIWTRLVLDKLAFFGHYFTFKNYKNIEEIAKIFFNQACNEYCIAKHI